MTVALDFADLADLADFAPVRRPLAPVPDRAPVPRPGSPRPAGARRPFDTTVVPLFVPGPAPAARPVRLTRRGLAVLAGAVLALVIAVVALAWASAPAAHSRPDGPSVVTVQAGDTLWSIAGRVAPNRDPRAEVADLQRINHLTSVALIPGQVLHTAG